MIPELLVVENKEKPQLEIKKILTNIKHVLYDLNGKQIYNTNWDFKQFFVHFWTTGCEDAIYNVKTIASEILEFISKISIKN